LKSIEPAANMCRLEIELPWEVVHLIVNHGPALLDAFRQVLAYRAEDEALQRERVAELEATRQRNHAQWAALAAYCRAEIARRSNGPGQQVAILKGIALERRVSVQFLRQIMRAFPEHRPTTKA
jgi:hypothetical protein